jgi:hypothetical protein
MSNIKEVELGSQGLTVPTKGLDCMGMTTGFGGDIYGKAAINSIHRSLELGGKFFGHRRYLRSLSKRTADRKSHSGKQGEILYSFKILFFEIHGN